VGDPANRAAQREQTESDTNRQLQMPPQSDQREIDRWMSADQFSAFVDKCLPRQVVRKYTREQRDRARVT